MSALDPLLDAVAACGGDPDEVQVIVAVNTATGTRCPVALDGNPAGHLLYAVAYRAHSTFTNGQGEGRTDDEAAVHLIATGVGQVPLGPRRLGEPFTVTWGEVAAALAVRPQPGEGALAMNQVVRTQVPMRRD